MRTAIIVSIVELVAMLFTAFGGFLREMLPASLDEARFFEGFVSFLAIICFLTIKALGYLINDETTTPYIFLGILILGIGGYTCSGLHYKWTFDQHMFLYPPDQEWYVAGSELTDRAQRLVDRELEISKEDHLQIVKAFALEPDNFHEIWTRDSIRDIRRMLVRDYLFTVVFLIVSIGASVQVLGSRFKLRQQAIECESKAGGTAAEPSRGVRLR